jgi:hypothetical protein
VHAPRQAESASEVCRRVLMDTPGDPLCSGCLSTICGASGDEMSALMASLLGDVHEFARGSRCTSCLRNVTAIYYRAKCAHCSGRLADGDKGMRIGEGLFHVACLRRLITDETIHLSRALGRRSRRLIAESRRRMRTGHGWPPLESP